jgi:hypothetical protein
VVAEASLVPFYLKVLLAAFSALILLISARLASFYFCSAAERALTSAIYSSKDVFLFADVL